MTATLYRSIVVRRAPLELLIDNKDFSSNQYNLIVVLAEKYHPSSASSSVLWSIDYIGTIRDFFLNYCASFSNSFHDGLISTELAYNSVDCYRMLEEKLKQAIPLGAVDFTSRGINACTWAQQQYSVIKDNWPDLVRVSHRGQQRYLHHLKNHFDIASFFTQYKAISQVISPLAGIHVNTLTPWVCNESLIEPFTESVC